MRTPSVQAFTARSGLLSVKVDGAALHSPYDPQKEAARFIDASLAADVPSAVVLLGAGLGYTEEALLARSPGCTVIAVCYSEEIHALRKPGVVEAWHPGTGESLGAFLRRLITELDVEGLRVLEWPPSAKAFGEQSRQANLSVQRAVAEASGSFTTTASFGRLWLRNTLINFLSLAPLHEGRLCGPSSPILVAAPGPGLEDVMEAVARARRSFSLWALPGSLLALGNAGISPDLVVMTDPGHWSVVHAHFSGLSCPVAMPLSAARGMWRFPVKIIPLIQPMFFENEVLSRAGVSAQKAPPHGTVTASALELALSSTRGPVIAAGLDLCARDILTHARPGAFDRLLRLGAGRLTPHYSQSYARACAAPHELIRTGSGMIRMSTALKTYAGWLGEMEEERLRRLSPSPVPLASMVPMTVQELQQLPAQDQTGSLLSPVPAYPDQARRRAIVSNLLGEWDSALEAGLGALAREGNPAGIPPQALTMAYYMAPRLLFTARRRLREGDAQGAVESARRTLDDSRAFIRSLKGKTGL